VTKQVPVNKKKSSQGFSLLTDEDLHLFNEGNHFCLYEKLGAHCMKVDGESGVYFAVWAPNAEKVHVIGDFNGWNRRAHPLNPKQQSGIWEGFLSGVKKGDIYKYYIQSNHHGIKTEKADPFSFYSEVPPKSGSIVWDSSYQWQDDNWVSKERQRLNSLNSAISIYEVHLGSWMRRSNEVGRMLTYRELALKLADYVLEMGFTHVEFLPVMEHPFYGSWGYQCTGYFAPTSRHGSPVDFMALVDHLHENGIGVLLDWVPSHFATDNYALGCFDGTHIYEHADDRQGFHPDWGSYIFNYGRNEVVSFLISNALYWLDVFHADGLRVDAVASMLYLDYSRKQGEWVPNVHGGRENLEALAFLRKLNETVYKEHPDVHVMAEESTDWPMVSKPTSMGGLGFGMKWDMGWMNDTLDYMQKDPIYRSHHLDRLTFRMIYAYHENFILPLSHDEVVHGKGSLLGRMPGDDWQKFANLRLLFGYMFTQPGKKLLFMGCEFGQWSEWNHEKSLDWHLLEYSPHRGVQLWVKHLNQLYRTERALYENDFSTDGFEWIDCNDSKNCILIMLRKGNLPEDSLVIILNFTPVPREGYRLGVPHDGNWKEILNSDSKIFFGSGLENKSSCVADSTKWHGQPYSVCLTLSPLSVIILKNE
jgi:1,4-alpha-glucan branching enzyme